MASTVSFANRSCRKYPSSATCRFARFVKRVFSFESAWAASGVFARCTRRHLFMQRRSRVCCPLNRRLQHLRFGAQRLQCSIPKLALVNAHFLSSCLSIVQPPLLEDFQPDGFFVTFLLPDRVYPSPLLSSLAFLLVACHLVNLAPER